MKSVYVSNRSVSEMRRTHNSLQHKVSQEEACKCLVDTVLEAVCSVVNVTHPFFSALCTSQNDQVS